MLRINVHDAKTHLSKYLAAVENGETVIICRRNKPVAEIRSIARAPKHKRLIGPDIPGFEIPESFFEPLSEEELAEWYDAPLTTAGDL
jgi:prevent-host-death family protein